MLPIPLARENRLRSRFLPDSWLVVVTLMPALMLGCATRTVVVRAMGPVLEDVARSVDEASDLELVEAGLPGNLLLLRGLLRGSPEDQALLLLASRACYGYAFAFLEDTSEDRAVRLYQEGFQYAVRALGELLRGEDPRTLSVDELKVALARAKEKHVPALFWLANNWGSWIQLEAGEPRLLAQLPKATAAMNTVLALDEGYFNGAAHVFFGIYHGSRPPALGGSIDAAESHLNRALELSGRRFLLPLVYRALYVHVPRGDKTGFDRDLRDVLAYPLDQAPSVRFYNQIARREARRLQARADELFELLE